MKAYEVWEGDVYVSSWNDNSDAFQEADRLNEKFYPYRFFHVVKGEDVNL